MHWKRAESSSHRHSTLHNFFRAKLSRAFAIPFAFCLGISPLHVSFYSNSVLISGFPFGITEKWKFKTVPPSPSNLPLDLNNINILFRADAQRSRPPSNRYCLFSPEREVFAEFREAFLSQAEVRAFARFRRNRKKPGIFRTISTEFSGAVFAEEWPVSEMQSVLPVTPACDLLLAARPVRRL